MTKPDVICIDCGHEGPAVKKSQSFFSQIGEVIVFIFLLVLGIIPGIIYAIYIHHRSVSDKNKRYCSNCGSSAIQLKNS